MNAEHHGRNIVLIITDDQDIELGSMDEMPKTLKILKEKGVYFSSGFVTTPICCPSRTSILTGKYVHNHNVHTNNCNCSGMEWKFKHEPNALPVHLQRNGYRTAYFGKYLNEYDGSYVPAGWDHWLGLVKNSKFYNYTVNFNGERLRYGNDYEKDYFTDLVTNKSIEFIHEHYENNFSQPFLIVISYPAPHGPEDPAPKYADMFMDKSSHRTLSWNYAPNPDKQWILQRTGKMDPVHVAFTDILHRRRLQTLQSVDEGVHQLFSVLREFNQVSNTYAFYTSDHGYHLGQFGLIKGKNMPYEFDIRVPYFVRGPGVPRNITVRHPVANIDLFPTILSIGGAKVPNDTDGRNLLELLKLIKDEKSANVEPWRDTILIERGKMPKLKRIRERFLSQKAKFGKEARLKNECSKPQWQTNCEPGQSWRCFKTADDKWRIYKCRDNRKLCECAEPRERRHAENFVYGNESVYDQFLDESYELNIMEDTNWKQGLFGHKFSTRFKRSCSCADNKTHPLRSADEVVEEEMFLQKLINKKESKKKNLLNYPERAACLVPQMNCFSHGADHWRTPPLWPDSYGNFCFCQNSNNNTYWCLRTVNETHNLLYCEFVTDFISYYDLNTDPHQLNNSVFSLEPAVLEELNQRLTLLKACRGASCEAYSSRNWKSYTQGKK
ncbi:unnamed protein product [Auanema sp. JU1783]|nr:unnamed protein product [Auanema sp. JU1783]